MTEDRTELRRRQLAAKMEANDRVVEAAREAAGGEYIVRDSEFPDIWDYEDPIRDLANGQRHQRNRLEGMVSRHGRFPISETYDVEAGTTRDLLLAWADGALRTTEVCQLLDCTPLDLFTTAAAHEVDPPYGARRPRFTLPDDADPDVFELVLSSGFSIWAEGGVDDDMPTDDLAQLDAALQGQAETTVLIVENTIPDEGWEAVGYLHLRDEVERLVLVSYQAELPTLARILESRPVLAHDASTPPQP